MNRCPLAPALLLTVLTAIPIAVAAQDHPHTCLHEAFDAFAFLEGEWTVASRYRNMEGAWEETTAAASITYDMGGCLLIEHFTGTRNGTPFEARAVLAFNPITNRLQRAWSDSGHGLLVLYEGTATSDSILLQSSLSIRDRTVLFQHAYLDVGTDTFRLESRRSTDAGATWDTSWYLTYQRAH